MRYIGILLLLLTGFTEILQAENISGKLTGNAIGSESYDYSTNSCSTSVNKPSCAFDGNFSTFYASCRTSNGWTGLDLGKKYILTKIAFCPRLGYQNKMILGVFEGANSPDFGDAIPLFIVTTSPNAKVLTAQTIHCSKGFRYVRYIGPNGMRSDVAELEFYGYEGEGDDSALTQIAQIPTVSIHTTDAEDIVEKETYINGIISIISENGSIFFTDSLQIKGRGNASWNFPKKPYRIKLNNKANVLGMPSKSKDWTLINNYGDKTLMRNLLAFDLSKRLEIPYTPSGKSVDVFLNGEYKGCYQLCDQIDVSANRVAVEKMEETDITAPNITGGYLLEMDAYANLGTSWFTSGRYYIPVTIKYPKDDDIVAAQKKYINDFFNSMENALYTNLSAGLSKYIDTETFVRHFLVGEFSGNTDTYWSTYLYKKRNDDKFYFGPVWDFDLAYENDNRTYPINNNPDWVYSSKGSTANGVRPLVIRILSNSGIYNQLKATYANYRNRGILSEAALLKVVDDFASEINPSQVLNFKRWNIMNTYVHQNPALWGSYEGEVENVKNYISNRILWMDKKLAYTPSSTEVLKASKIFLWCETHTLHIEGLSENAKIQVVDLTGRILLKAESSGQWTTNLDRGGYIVRISDNLSGDQALKCLIP